MVFFSLYPRDFASSLREKRESLLACSSLELIFKVVITWRDLLKNYSAMMVLKDKCRKWYFVPELILLPWAHWKILELLYKSQVSLSRAENDIEGMKWLLLMSMAGFGEGTSGSEVGPRKCLSLHSTKTGGCLRPWSWPGNSTVLAGFCSHKASQWLRTSCSQIVNIFQPQPPAAFYTYLF